MLLTCYTFLTCSPLQLNWGSVFCLMSAALLCPSGYLALELWPDALVPLSRLSVISDVCHGRFWASNPASQACKAPLVITVKEFLHLSLIVLTLQLCTRNWNECANGSPAGPVARRPPRCLHPRRQKWHYWCRGKLWQQHCFLATDLTGRNTFFFFKKKNFFFEKIFICVYVSVGMCLWMRVPEEGVESPGVGRTDDGELPSVGAGN